MTRAFYRWPLFLEFIEDHRNLYVVTFVAIQAVLFLMVALFLGMKYAPALWIPRPSLKGKLLLCALILVPLLAFHSVDIFSALPSLVRLGTLAGEHEEARRVLSDLHDQVWGTLAYGGPSLAGVISVSFVSLIGPIYEETMFAGLLANRFTRHLNPLITLFAIPCFFALAHVPAFGFSSHLLPLYFAGLTYSAIRFYSGSLALSVASHILVNIVVLFPKWIVAALHFYSP